MLGAGRVVTVSNLKHSERVVHALLDESKGGLRFAETWRLRSPWQAGGRRGGIDHLTSTFCCAPVCRSKPASAPAWTWLHGRSFFSPVRTSLQTLALCGVLASPDGIDRQWLRHQEPPSAATIYPRLMSDDASAQSMISRLRAAAAEYDPAKERATMEPVWEMASSTDKGLRTCLMENSIAVRGGSPQSAGCVDRPSRRSRARRVRVTSSPATFWVPARIDRPTSVRS